jgi:hypothetical protein
MPAGVAVKTLLLSMRDAAAEKGERTDAYDQPDPGAGDVRVIKRLDEALANDEDTELPEGYKRVLEKDVDVAYTVPDSLPLTDDKRLVLEVLDDIMSEKLGFHILEP